MFPSRKRPRTSLGSASCWSSGDLQLPAGSDEAAEVTRDGQSSIETSRVSRRVIRRKVVVGPNTIVSPEHSLFPSSQDEANNEFHVANFHVQPSVSTEPAVSTNGSILSTPPVNRPVPSAEVGCSSSTNIVRGQAAFQQTLQRNVIQYEDFGDKTFECIYCGALFWLREAIQKKTANNQPIFSLCCLKGKLSLPFPNPTPPLLEYLLDPINGHISIKFRENIRPYNSMFSFASMGAKVEHLNNGSGPYIFKISGQIHHLMGSLVPPDGECPKFAQLYIYDTYNEVKNRLNALNSNRPNENLDESIVADLIQMFDEVNELTKLFRTARDKFEEGSLINMKMQLLGREVNDNKQYEEPTSDEIGGLIVGDIGLSDSNRDIIIEHKTRELQRISNLHPKFMALHYPLLFPYGEDGFFVGLKWSSQYTGPDPKRENVPMRAFIVYYLQERKPALSTLLKGGRLFQQYLVDAYATVEDTRLGYLKRNQKDLRSESYKDVYEAAVQGNSHGSDIGKKVILPSSYTGSDRYMLNNYQDAMALCRHFGNPDLFITFTCNVKWPEIVRELTNFRGYKPEDRPDIVSRVFRMKLIDMIAFIKSGHVFGEVDADVCTIEFQKRGLPHAHLLVWLKQAYKCFSAQDLNSIISAEIPNKSTDPVLYDIVDHFMIHGPCGPLNPNSPCMKSGKCSKFFPKSYASETVHEINSFPTYMRRDHDTKFVIRNGMRIHNSFIVPYNATLLLRYNAHINVESCCQSMLIKYLFKYITKGTDRARMIIQDTPHDEIQAYLNCRYLSPYESVWRLFEYPIHSRHPSVEILPIHLPLEQNVIFHSQQSLNSIVQQEDMKHSKLTRWFEANALFPEAKTLTYLQFPTQFVWEEKQKVWKLRERGFSIGRIAYINPACGELYYLRMLLHFQKGAISFDALKTIGDTIYPSYQSACEALGLLSDDNEWVQALSDVIAVGSCPQIRQLFVTLLIYCDITNPIALFDTHWQHMCDDIMYTQRHLFHMPNLIVPEVDLKNCLLYELEELMHASSRSLQQFGLPLPDENRMVAIKNRLLREELCYDTVLLKSEHSRLISQLNVGQRHVYDCVIDAVVNRRPKMFFVHGHGGTGKTFLWHTILSKIRSEGKIVLAVASSGIASLLLPGGRTAHSRFRIPLSVTECSTCHIKKNTDAAKLLEKTELIVWDEAPMNHRYCFEALDKTLCDLLLPLNTVEHYVPFGGKPVLLGGDFRQILPVIPAGSRAQIVNASLNSSYLWPFFTVLSLTENMRLLREGLSEQAKQEISEFANWILQVGNGKLSGQPDAYDQDASWIEIPPDLLLDTNTNALAAIFASTYPDFVNCFDDFTYLRERAIITPKNSTVSEINEFALQFVPGDSRTYLSSDSMCSSTENSQQLQFLYPVDFLNQLEFSGLPVHRLILKVGMPIMLLRNLNQSLGLCNGTRLIVTQLANRVIQAKILAGANVGHTVFIPRIILTATETKWPFILKRRQFPVRPCYAMTINKSQGQSLRQVGLYLPQSVFTHGQLYVALSRVTSREGLKIIIENNNELPNNFAKNIVFKDVLQNL